MRSAALLLALLVACDGGQIGGGADAGAPGPGDVAAADAIVVVGRDAAELPDGLGGSDVDEATDAEPLADAEALDAAPAPDAVADLPDAAPPDGGVGPARPLFLAAGYGTRRAISRDAVTWTHDVVVDPNGGDDNNLLRGAAWGDGRFIVVGGGAQGRSHVSLDGITWTNEVTGLRAFLSQVQFGNGVWVAVGGNGYRVRSLDHGASWVDDSGYYQGHFRRLAFGRGVFVAVGHTYGARTVGLVASTTDGVRWTTAEQPNLGSLGDVAFGNDVFVATGGNRVTTSPDGVTWTEANLTSAGFGGVSFVNGEHVVPCREGLWRSTDGAQWTRVDGFAPGAIAYASGVYVGVVWQSQRWTTRDLAQGWTRAGTDDGAAFTEIVVGDVP